MFQKLRHRINAQNRHGVHSPLVYELVDAVLLRPDGTPVQERVRRHFANWTWQELTVAQLADAALHAPFSVVFVPAPHDRETGWMTAATHPAVSIAIDCWDFGLLLATPDVKMQQYFRLRYDP